MHEYINALLSLSHLPDPIAFCNIVGKEEDAEKEEDMKNSKQNEEEARAVVSAQPTYPVHLIYHIAGKFDGIYI